MGTLPWEPPLEKNRKKSQANKVSLLEHFKMQIQGKNGRNF